MQFELWARTGRDGTPEYHLLVPADPRYGSERARLGSEAELLERFEAGDHMSAMAVCDDLIRRRVEALQPPETRHPGGEGAEQP